MSAGLLLVTHGETGRELVDTAQELLGACPLELAIVGVKLDADTGAVDSEIARHMQAIDSGEGVLVLTDLFGSTPGNLAMKALERGSARVVSGINLSMLIRVMNYPTLTLDELAAKAATGGRDGVVLRAPGDNN